MLEGQRLLPSGHMIVSRCTTCLRQWSPWRHPSAYPTTMPTLGLSWRTRWRRWHPTRSTRRRYCRRHINTWSYFHVVYMVKKAQKAKLGDCIVPTCQRATGLPICIYLEWFWNLTSFWWSLNIRHLSKWHKSTPAGAREVLSWCYWATCSATSTWILTH